MSKQLGVIGPEGRFHPHSSGDMGSVIATGVAKARVRGVAHQIASRDERGRVTRIGTVNPASNGIARGKGR